MKIDTVVLQSTLALLAAGSLVMSVPVYAAAISGAFTVRVSKQEVLPVSAQSGDMLMLVESHGANKSSNWMDDAQVVNKEIDFVRVASLKMSPLLASPRRPRWIRRSRVRQRFNSLARCGGVTRLHRAVQKSRF
jgi:hypothetical protein